LKTEQKTRLVDLFGFEYVLHDLVIGDELVLMLGIHLDPGHWQIAWNTPDQPIIRELVGPMSER